MHGMLPIVVVLIGLTGALTAALHQDDGTIATWGALTAALHQTGISGTFTLSGASFQMTGYPPNTGQDRGAIQISAGNVTIPGAGAVMDAKFAGSYFYIAKGASLTLEYITLQNGDALGGGGGAVFTDGSFTAEHCQFSGNQATQMTASGGAVALGNEGYPQCGQIANFRTCTFNDNSAGNGGAVDAGGSGAKASFRDCAFFGNKANQQGNDVFADPPYSNVVFLDCPSTIPMHDCCTIPTCPSLMTPSNTAY
jgi:hypothetical protein